MKGPLAVLIVSLVLGSSLGCSSLEEDPGTPMEATPHSSGPIDQGLLDAVPVVGPILDSVTGIGDQLGPLERVISAVSRLINGLLGGKVQNGRYTLEFKPGSFNGLLRISIVDLGRERPGCDLFPEGVLFERPARLTVDLRGTPFDDGNVTVYWFDPATREWVDVGGVYSPATHSISTELEHFSTYAVDRKRGTR